MRVLLLIASIALAGCDFIKSPGPSAQVSDRSGRHRLLMRYVPSGEGYDFDALIWRTRGANGWTQRLVLSHEDFQRGSDRRRWVRGLHSFDSISGNAIVKVGEFDTSNPAAAGHVVYSWREWNLLTNREVRLIRFCVNPSERY